MSYNADEIDLRPYIRQIIRRGWIIILLGILFAGLAYIYSRKQPKSYSATSIILLTRSRPILNLAQQFPTVNDPVDVSARLNAILTLLQSDVVTKQVFEDLRKSSGSVPPSLTSLKSSISVSNKGDAVLITASSSNANLAIQIANTWATESVSIINQAYSKQQPLSDIQSQIGTAEQQYKNAQTELETYIENSQIDFIKQRITESTELLAKLDGDRATQIDYFSSRAQTMQETVSQAEALKKQLESSDNSTAGELGDALAVLNTRAIALGINTDKSNINFQVTDPKSLIDSKDKYSADLDAIIQQAQAEEEKANSELETLAKSIIQGQNTPMREEAASQLSDLEKLLENRQTRQKELATKRDTALNAYQALLQKETEITNGPQESNEVNVASLAITPIGPVSQNATRNSMVAGMLGLFLGIVGVLGVEWWRSASVTNDTQRPYSEENIQERAQPISK